MPADINDLISRIERPTSIDTWPLGEIRDVLLDVQAIVDSAITEGDLGSKIARYFGKEFPTQ